MCGIIGYVGHRKPKEVILGGLKRLEYRGYDSAGVAVGGKVVKAVGRLSALEKKLETSFFDRNIVAGIGHTRWATHGKPVFKNAHPHVSQNKNIKLVHNGIIENYKELKKGLTRKGHQFRSDTDTEVLAHLIEEMEGETLEEKTRSALALVRGTYGLAVTWEDEPEKLVAARRGSPLLVGVGEGEFILASDASAVLPYTNNVFYLNDGEVAALTKDGYEVSSLREEVVEKTPQVLEWTLEDAQKGGYEHFMLKEIMEGPRVIENALRGRLIMEEGLAKLGGLEIVQDKLRDVDEVIFVACGTALYAAKAGALMLQEYASISARAVDAAEFRVSKLPLHKKQVIWSVSQSGETADTLAALREAKRKGIMNLGMVNVVDSSVARETDAGVYNHAGPEIGVASTKAFLSQLSVMALLTLFLGRSRSMSSTVGVRIAEELSRIPRLAEKMLSQRRRIKELAKKYSRYNNFFFLGRKYQLPIAEEGALKLKEVSYIHAEGYGGGTMKHGPLALVDKNFPSLFLALKDSTYDKMKGNVEEVRARSGPALIVASEGDCEAARNADDVLAYVPKTLEMLSPLLSVIPLQLFAYYVGTKKGYDVDKPRNLAKSVTVE